MSTLGRFFIHMFCGIVLLASKLAKWIMRKLGLQYKKLGRGNTTRPTYRVLINVYDWAWRKWDPAGWLKTWEHDNGMRIEPCCGCENCEYLAKTEKIAEQNLKYNQLLMMDSARRQ